MWEWEKSYSAVLAGGNSEQLFGASGTYIVQVPAGRAGGLRRVRVEREEGRRPLVAI